MTQSWLDEVNSQVEKHFQFLPRDFEYEPKTPERTSHARHAFLKRYRYEKSEVRIVLFDWDTPERHWTVYFCKDIDSTYPIKPGVDPSIFTIANRLAIDIPIYPSDAITSNQYTLDDILRELSCFTRTHATEVLKGDFSLFQ